MLKRAGPACDHGLINRQTRFACRTSPPSPRLTTDWAFGWCRQKQTTENIGPEIYHENYGRGRASDQRASGRGSCRLAGTCNGTAAPRALDSETAERTWRNYQDRSETDLRTCTQIALS